MANYVAIQRSIHKDAGYQPTTNFKFAAHMPTVPLVAEELAHVTQHMAVAFQAIHPGTEHERFELVGVQSIVPNKNLFVVDDGRWLTGYRPAFYRSHPFALLTNPETQQIEMSIDSDHVVENPDENTPRLFDEEENLTKQLRKTVEFLGKTLQNRNKTMELCRELQDAGLIKPWAIKFSSSDKDGESQIRTLQGLCHIDTNALKALDGEILTKLNQSGALELAYAQLLSEPRVSGLGTLANVHQKLEAKAKQQDTAAEIDLDDLFGDNDEMFSF